MGIIIYEILCGRHPFSGYFKEVVIVNILMKEPEKPSKLNPEINEELENIILKCLNKNQKDRYQSVDEFIKDLKKCSEKS